MLFNLGMDAQILESDKMSTIRAFQFTLQSLIILLPLWIWSRYKYTLKAKDYGFKKIGIAKTIEETLIHYMLFIGITALVGVIIIYTHFKIPGYQAQPNILPTFGEGIEGIEGLVGVGICLESIGIPCLSICSLTPFKKSPDSPVLLLNGTSGIGLLIIASLIALGNPEFLILSSVMLDLGLKSCLALVISTAGNGGAAIVVFSLIVCDGNCVLVLPSTLFITILAFINDCCNVVMSAIILKFRVI